MDYCKKCKKQTKSIGKPKFIKKNKRWRRISICRICHSEKNNISKSPEEIDIEELFKPARKYFKTRHFIQRGIDDTWQADLYTFYRPKGKSNDSSYNLRTTKTKPDNDFKKMLRENNGYKYILVVIDTFSKYVWTVPLKTKTGSEVADAFLYIFQNERRKPNKLHVDQGKEFYNKNVRDVLDKYKIDMYSTGTENKASIVERFNRTLGNKLKPMLYRNFNWIDILPKVINNYNNTYHRTIKMKPNEVNKDNEQKLLASVYNYKISKSKPKFELEDRVRLSAYIDIFRNKFKTNWTKEIFTITDILRENIVFYKVNDINEAIYQEELQLSKL
jgi:hypothetical protein